jgi:type I restriction enzyme R subunit
MPSGSKKPDSEWLTRKERIDPRLDACGWGLPKRNKASGRDCCRSEEEETDSGPADYALWLDNRVHAIVEAKRGAVGAQNVLTQAERYARALKNSPFNYDGLRAPFLYSTNGEAIWFRDARHSLNRSRQVARFHTPTAIREMMARDFDASTMRLKKLPNAHKDLRPYQRDANEAVEKAIAARKRSMLVAMATGTGKTFTLVNQIYRLMKSGVAQRVLFLVDRRALAAQAVRAFGSFEAEPGHKFDSVYEVYSNRFQREDFGDDEKFDSKLIPAAYLTKPSVGHAFVYVSTIQRMAINVLGRDAIFGVGDEAIDADADRLDIPIHAFDLIVADECHRGYTASEQSVWRSTLDHFDAIKIGLTATPASHTMSYFEHLVYKYDYRRAVEEGFLVDYDEVHINSKVRMNGVFLKEGEEVHKVDPQSGAKQLDLLEDERKFESTEIEAKITAPDSNRKIIQEVKKYADAHEQRTGRFPKTLIFAANDLAHTSHADQLVNICRDVFGRGDAFVQKITGSKDVDRPLQRIREFRNRPNPGIAVTVDLLSTGVDIPDLEFIVFLRPVKSRILFEQMLGRGTRRGLKFPDKSHFTIFDCFDGTLLGYFKAATGITEEAPVPMMRTITEIISDIWNNQERDYNIHCLAKRLHRIDKEMAAEARQEFGAFIPDGDIGRFAAGLESSLRREFVKTMKILRNEDFQQLLTSYKRPPRVFYVAPGVEDQVKSRSVTRDGKKDLGLEDYLAAFSRFVKENPAKIKAFRILLNRPKDWSPAVLSELRERLSQHSQFRIDTLQKAHERHYRRSLVDIISMVKHAADAEQPLLTASARVERAFKELYKGQSFSVEEKHWLDRIRDHLVENLSIDRDDFDDVPIFAHQGGWSAARRVFGKTKLESILKRINEAIAA